MRQSATKGWKSAFLFLFKQSRDLSGLRGCTVTDCGFYRLALALKQKSVINLTLTADCKFKAKLFADITGVHNPHRTAHVLCLLRFHDIVILLLPICQSKCPQSKALSGTHFEFEPRSRSRRRFKDCSDLSLCWVWTHRLSWLLSSVVKSMLMIVAAGLWRTTVIFFKCLSPAQTAEVIVSSVSSRIINLTSQQHSLLNSI